MPKIKLTDNQHNYQINKNIYKNIWSYQKKDVTLHPQMRDKNLAKFAKLCGNSSVGRAQPCQGWGRGFESRFPLNFIKVPAQVVKLVYTLL